jgi:hypothetical protein
MSDENITRVTMIGSLTGKLIEIDVPTHVAEGWQRDWPNAGRGWPQRRFSADDAIAMLRARIDQIDARRDELVDAHRG